LPKYTEKWLHELTHVDPNNSVEQFACEQYMIHTLTMCSRNSVNFLELLTNM